MTEQERNWAIIGVDYEHTRNKTGPESEHNKNIIGTKLGQSRNNKKARTIKS